MASSRSFLSNISLGYNGFLNLFKPSFASGQNGESSSFEEQKLGKFVTTDKTKAKPEQNKDLPESNLRPNPANPTQMSQNFEQRPSHSKTTTDSVKNVDFHGNYAQNSDIIQSDGYQENTINYSSYGPHIENGFGHVNRDKESKTCRSNVSSSHAYGVFHPVFSTQPRNMNTDYDSVNTQDYRLHSTGLNTTLNPQNAKEIAENNSAANHVNATARSNSAMRDHVMTCIPSVNRGTEREFPGNKMPSVDTRQYVHANKGLSPIKYGVGEQYIPNEPHYEDNYFTHNNQSNFDVKGNYMSNGHLLNDADPETEKDLYTAQQRDMLFLPQNKTMTSHDSVGKLHNVQMPMPNANHKTAHNGTVPGNFASVFPRPNRKPKEPDQYNGTSVEWQDYICHFDQVASWNQWSPEERAAQLVMSLRGVAQRALSELPSETLSSYESLKLALMLRFSPPERETSYRCEFRNRRRFPGETVTEYGFALKRLGGRAFPTIPSDMRESLIVEQYILGFSDPKIKRHIQFSHPATLDRAISLAVEFEAFEGSLNVLRKPAPELEHTPVMALSRSGSVQKSEMENNSSAKLTALENSIKDIQESLKLIAKTPRAAANDGRSSQDQNRTYRGRRGVQCYFCKKDGHIRRDCPERQQSNPRNASGESTVGPNTTENGDPLN